MAKSCGQDLDAPGGSRPPWRSATPSGTSLEKTRVGNLLSRGVNVRTLCKVQPPLVTTGRALFLPSMQDGEGIPSFFEFLG